MSQKIGYIHLYTGNGKGKTSAALGTALRMLGAGGAVWIGQFLKKGECSEHVGLRRFGDRVVIHQFGQINFIDLQAPSDQDRLQARDGLALAEKVISAGEYDLVILDEAALAAGAGLITSRDLIATISKKNSATEIIITGRTAPPELVQAADLVTEMREIKHYFQKGIPARRGIEF
jgi:cob(I)alamin adenosyltransferase